MILRIVTPEETLSFDANSEEVTIGRASENDFVVPLADFSRKHCKVTIRGDYIFIMDLGSKNGVHVDGRRIPPHQQIPIYQHSKVILANHFPFFLPEGTGIKNSDELSLEDIPKR